MKRQVVDFSSQRQKMLDEQLIPRGIKNAQVLEAMRTVPRHKFVSKGYLNSGYGDYPLPIGQGQTISQPYMVALMTECLGLSGKEKVLEIGTGSGYQAAILAELAAKVFSIERMGSLGEKAKNKLSQLGYHNVTIKIGDGTMGWPEFAPYDGIIVTAATPQIPKPLISQLKNKGKMVIPVGGSFSQTLTEVTKHKGKIKTQQICGCVFVPLVGRYGY